MAMVFLNKMEIKLKKGILIPENWTFKSLTDNTLCTLIKPGISYFSETKVYLSTSEVNGDKYDLTQNKITYKNRESRANMEPKPNSIWFAKMKNSIKHMAFTEDSDLIKKSILSTGFCGIKCDLNSFSYIWSIIHMPWFETIKDKIASGSTQEAVSEMTLFLYTDICLVA